MRELEIHCLQVPGESPESDHSLALRVIITRKHGHARLVCEREDAGKEAPHVHQDLAERGVNSREERGGRGDGGGAFGELFHVLGNRLRVV